MYSRWPPEPKVARSSRAGCTSSNLINNNMLYYNYCPLYTSEKGTNVDKYGQKSHPI
jgi:hypothetical protein